MDSPSILTETPAKSESSSGCLNLAIFIPALIWITSVVYIRLFINMTASINPGDSTTSIARGGVIAQIIMVALPLLFLGLFWPNPRYRAIYKTWALASIPLVLYLPVFLPYITAAQTQAVLHIVITGIFLALLLLISRFEAKKTQSILRNNDYAQSVAIPTTSRSSALLWLIILLIASISSYPWLAWGAFGSFLDTLLGLSYAMVFGFSAAFLMLVFLFIPSMHNQSSRIGDFFLYGLSAATTLLLLVSATAYPFGIMQILLILVLTGIAWSFVGLKLIFQPRIALSATTNSLFRMCFPFSVLFGLIAAAPMTLIDPDELALIATSSAGEILSFAWRAAVISMSVGLVFGVIFMVIILFRRHPSNLKGEATSRFSRGTALLGLVTGIAIIIAGVIYFASGQVGLYGERMFVIFKDQADVSSAREMSDYNARRQFVYLTLVEHANGTQAGIRKTFDAFRIDYTPYYLVNAIEVSGNPLVRLWLLSRPEVDRILDSPRMRPLPEQPPSSAGMENPPSIPEWNITTINADRVWKELGATGKGIVVGQSDSGVQWDHPELIDSYRGKSGDHNYNWLDPWNNSQIPTDINGHGTHTLGSILGKKTGVAPEATWYGCVNLARNLGNPALYLDCMQFMLAPYPMAGNPLLDGDPGLGAHVINNSWGCPEIEGCDADTFLYAVRALRDAGVFVVASAGNDGPNCDTLNTPPPIYAESFAVGAIDRFGNLAPFSSIGPVTVDGSHRVKPDIVAPGVDVLSSTPQNSYASYSGTSMAGPHVVGVVALIWSANPALIGQIEQTEQILISTAQPYKGPLPACPGTGETPSTAVGYGIVDAYAAVKEALGK